MTDNHGERRTLIRAKPKKVGACSMGVTRARAARMWLGPAGETPAPRRYRHKWPRRRIFDLQSVNVDKPSLLGRTRHDFRGAAATGGRSTFGPCPVHLAERHITKTRTRTQEKLQQSDFRRECWPSPKLIHGRPRDYRTTRSPVSTEVRSLCAPGRSELVRASTWILRRALRKIRVSGDCDWWPRLGPVEWRLPAGASSANPQP